MFAKQEILHFMEIFVKIHHACRKISESPKQRYGFLYLGFYKLYNSVVFTIHLFTLSKKFNDSFTAFFDAEVCMFNWYP